MDVAGANLSVTDVKQRHDELEKILELEDRRNNSDFAVEDAQLLEELSAALRRKLNACSTMDVDEMNEEMDRVVHLSKWYHGGREPERMFTARASQTMDDKTYGLFQFVCKDNKLLADRRVAQVVRNDRYGHFLERRQI